MSYIGELIGLERKLKETTDEQEREKNRCQKQAYLRVSDTQIAGMKRMQRGRR